MRESTRREAHRRSRDALARAAYDNAGWFGAGMCGGWGNTKGPLWVEGSWGAWCGGTLAEEGCGSRGARGDGTAGRATWWRWMTSREGSCHEVVERGRGPPWVTQEEEEEHMCTRTHKRARAHAWGTLEAAKNTHIQKHTQTQGRLFRCRMRCVALRVVDVTYRGHGRSRGPRHG